MNLAVVNCGSGSQQVSCFALPDKLPDEPLDPLWDGRAESTGPGVPEGRARLRVQRSSKGGKPEMLDELHPGKIVQLLFQRLKEDEGDIAVDAVAHRVVHGGWEFDEAVEIDARVLSRIEHWAEAAPLHNPENLKGIRTARAELGHAVPQYAVFDTAFHRTLPMQVQAYPGPLEWFDRGILRYGFHGTSFRWACDRAARLLGHNGTAPLRMILCHLGGGCSLCAAIGGMSIETTMGYTPLDGIAMCTRSGEVDPGILFKLMREGATVDELENTLTRESGLHGLSGLAGDTRVVLPHAHAGEAPAMLAWAVFVHRLRAGIGRMLAALGCVPDAIVFTDSIGESTPEIRTAACEPFQFLGLSIDEVKNAGARDDCDIAAEDSAVRAIVVGSREAWQIAREVHALTHPLPAGCSAARW
jgi:acetate kinase